MQLDPSQAPERGASTEVEAASKKGGSGRSMKDLGSLFATVTLLFLLHGLQWSAHTHMPWMSSSLATASANCPSSLGELPQPNGVTVGV